MSEQAKSWTVSSETVVKYLNRSPKALIKEMKEWGFVSSATREIIEGMTVPDVVTAQIILTPVKARMVAVQAEEPPLWVALAIFLERHLWRERMMAAGIRRIIVMHGVKETQAGKGRLTVSLSFRERKGLDGEIEEEVVWEIAFTFSGGEGLANTLSAQVHEEVSFFGVPMSQLDEKVVPEPMREEQLLMA